jgi:hypothetical protein
MPGGMDATYGERFHQIPKIGCTRRETQILRLRRRMTMFWAELPWVSWGEKLSWNRFESVFSSKPKLHQRFLKSIGPSIGRVFVAIFECDLD